MKTTLIALTALMLAAPMAHAAESQQGMNSLSQLDGTKWNITAMPTAEALKKGESNFQDTMIFANSRLSLEKSEMSGFPASQYTTKLSKDRQTFSAVLKSPKEGTAQYDGWLNRDRDRISGTIAWTRANGEKITYTFDGNKSE